MQKIKTTLSESEDFFCYHCTSVRIKYWDLWYEDFQVFQGSDWKSDKQLIMSRIKDAKMLQYTKWIVKKLASKPKWRFWLKVKVQMKSYFVSFDIYRV